MLRGLRIAALCVMGRTALGPGRLGAIGGVVLQRQASYAPGRLGGRRWLRRLCPDWSRGISGASFPAIQHFVVQNMAGAAGAVAAGNLYNVAAKDGTAMEMFQREVLIAPLLESRNID